MSECDFEIVYVKGSSHNDVDCLSRAPVDQYVEPYLDEKIATITRLPPNHSVNPIVPLEIEKWKKLLNEDEAAKDHYARARRREVGYRLLHVLLYYEDVLLVPKTLQKKVMEESHDNFPSDHGGIRDTLNRAKDYWWPEMANMIREYVSSCRNWQANKVRRDKPKGSMNSFEASYPMELVAIDVFGPLPKSINQKEHVFVALDGLRMFVELMAAEDTQAATCVSFLRGYIGRYGIPSNICTDNGRTFDNGA